MTILEYLSDNSPATVRDIAEGVGRPRNSVSTELTGHKKGGRVSHCKGLWSATGILGGDPGRPPYTHDADPAEVGRALRARREILRLTRAQVAKRSGVTQRAVGQMERGRGSLATALAIWTALGLELRPKDPGDRAAVREWLLERLSEL